MKRLLLFTLLLTGITTHAVPLQPKKKKQMPERYMLPQDVIVQQASRLAHKSTAVQKRLVGTSYWDNGMRSDSTKYTYNGNVRGSVHPNISSYYTSYSLLSSSADQYIKCDTVKRFYNTGSGSLDLVSSSFFVYNSQNLVTQNQDNYTFGFFRTDGTYGTGNRLTEVTSSDTFNGTGLVPKRRTYIFYDGQGRRTMDSSYNLVTQQPDSKRLYYYDSKGNLDSFTSYGYVNSVWELSFRTTYIYDVSDRVVKRMYEGDYGTGFMNQSRDSFAYVGTATNPIYQLNEEWYDVNQSWVPFEIYEYSLNANLQPSFYVIYRYTQQWDTLELDAYGYDANGLLIQSNGYLYLGNGQFATVPYDQSNLYYEEHDPSSVGNIITANNNVTVYPNPGSASVTVNAQNGQDIHIVNIKGQAIYTGRLLNNTTTVDVATWPSGNYWVIINDENGNTLSKAAFVKQ